MSFGRLMNGGVACRERGVSVGVRSAMPCVVYVVGL